MSTKTTAAQRKAAYTPSRELLVEALPALESKIRTAESAERELDIVSSVTESLYAELDKLSKKSPVHEMSNLALAQVNQIIADAKSLLVGDPYVDRIKEFVAAGDNPEHRDAVLILGQIKAGIDRGKPDLVDKTKSARKLLAEAKALDALLAHFESGDEDYMEAWRALERVNDRWFRAGNFSPTNLEGRIRERFID